MALFIIFCMLLGFLSGYITGKKIGTRNGEELGMLYAPFEIRKSSLEKGRCAICNNTINCDKSTSMIE